MATTTNYGWTTPDDTALVKDGAAAIRTLGTSVDTTTKALNPSTTLGDIEYRSSTANTNTRLGIGSTGNVLTVTGGVPVWAAPSGGAGNLALITSGSLSGTSLSVSSLSTYTNIYIFLNGVTFSAGSDDDTRLRINGTTTSVYRSIGSYISGSTSNFSDIARQAIALDTGIILTKPSVQASGPNGNTFILNLYNCKNTGFTSFNLQSAYNGSGGSPRYSYISSGVFEDSAAVSSINYATVSGFTFDGGTYRIYGE